MISAIVAFNSYHVLSVDLKAMSHNSKNGSVIHIFLLVFIFSQLTNCRILFMFFLWICICLLLIFAGSSWTERAINTQILLKESQSQGQGERRYDDLCHTQQKKKNMWSYRLAQLCNTNKYLFFLHIDGFHCWYYIININFSHIHSLILMIVFFLWI